MDPGTGALKLSGTLDELKVADILSGAATFAAAIDGPLTTFTLTATDLRIGDALKLTTGSFALAHRDGTIAAIASNLSGTLALGGVLTATLSGGGLKVNRGSFDWSTAPVGDINFSAPIAEATGTLSALEIAGFASAAGSFTLTTTPELTDLALTLTSFRIGEAAGPRLTASGTLALPAAGRPAQGHRHARRRRSSKASTTSRSRSPTRASSSTRPRACAAPRARSRRRSARARSPAPSSTSARTARTVVAFADATVKVGSQDTLKEGDGVLVLKTEGIAGFLTGKAAFATGGVQINGRILFRVNTTGAAVDQSVDVNGRTLTVSFGAAEGDTFSVSVSDLELNIAGVVTVKGAGTFKSGTLADGTTAGRDVRRLRPHAVLRRGPDDAGQRRARTRSRAA